ncbi:MAG: Inner spore coat protein H [Owenweeksia sp. TMED14]|nr:MAG: Inner spore coat protein H [Owenweeksia sp. TMED14]
MNIVKYSFRVCVFIFTILISLVDVIIAQSIPNPPRAIGYNNQSVGSVYIYLSPDSLSAILDDVTSDKEYKSLFVHHLNNTIDTVEEVGFRLRGNTSRYSAKKSFKVSFNTFSNGGRWNGVKGLNLNGEHNDPSISRARIGWDILEDMGLASARANHVKLYINNSYYGIYANIEHINDDFVLHRFGDDSGNLYKCLWPATLEYISSNPNDYKFSSGGRRAYDLKTNIGSDNYTGLANFIYVLNNTPIGDLACSLESIFDVDEYLYYLAFEIAIGHWDNHAYNKNNFYLYDNPIDGRFHYIPFDLDNTFGIDWVGKDWGIRDINNWGNPANHNSLYQRVLSIPKYKSKMQLLLKNILEHMTSNDFINKILSIRGQVSNHISNDAYYTYDYGYDSTDLWQSWISASGGHVDYGINPYIAARKYSAFNQFSTTNSQPIFFNGTLIGNSNQGSILASIHVIDENTPAQVSLKYREINDSLWTTVILSDNGTNGDRIAGDGNYEGSLQPSNTSFGIEYYWTAIDILGLSSNYPCTYITKALHPHSPIIINELMSRNKKYITDQNGDDSDWLELYNPSGSSVSISNIFISDDESNPGKFQLKNNTISGNGYALLWASGDTSQYFNHLPFKLKGNGEKIALYIKVPGGSYVLLDKVNFPALEVDQSYGRKYDGNAQWVTFQNNPTPNSTNAGILSLSVTPKTNQPFPYPNPFREYLYFKNTWKHDAQIYLHNQLGQLMFERVVPGNTEIEIFDNSPSGIYILSAKGKTNTLHFKLKKL